MAKRNSDGMRCLSIRQPWAWLVAAGMKLIENRTWSTDFRGTIAIHASTSNSVVKDYVRNRKTDLFSVDDFSYGAIVGFADLADVRIFGREHESDHFACGPYCWHMSNPRLLKSPIPMLGKLNLFYLDDAITEQLKTAETYCVDLSSNSRDAQIARAMLSDADPIAGYSYTLEELDGKIDDDQLLWRANRMLELDPENVEGNFCRLRLALGSQSMENALEDVKRLMEVCPEDVEVLKLCARAYYLLNDFPNSVSAANRSIELESEPNPWMVFQRGLARIELGQFSEALPDVADLLAHATTAVDKSLVYNYVALIHRNLKQFADAEDAIRLALQLQPKDAVNHLEAARIAKDKGDVDSARKHATTALQIDATYTEAEELLASF